MVTINAKREEIEQRNQEFTPKTCTNCGHSGIDVHEYQVYVGGVGYEWRYQCDNIPECWARWDEKNGLATK